MDNPGRFPDVGDLLVTTMPRTVYKEIRGAMISTEHIIQPGTVCLAIGSMSLPGACVRWPLVFCPTLGLVCPVWYKTLDGGPAFDVICRG